MNDCPATSLINLDGEDIVVICDRGWHSGDDHHDVIHGEWDGSPTATLCPICLASAPRGTNMAREHLLTHDREQLVTVIRALGNDLAQALRKIKGKPGA